MTNISSRESRARANVPSRSGRGMSLASNIQSRTRRRGGSFLSDMGKVVVTGAATGLGAAAGSALGSGAGPVGTAVGGATGSLVGAAAGKTLSRGIFGGDLTAELLGYGVAPRASQPKLLRSSLRW
jgi:phage tail tape-measure protein